MTVSTPIKDLVSKQISFPDVRPKVSYEEFTEGSWSGSANHYYQSFSLSKQFDLATTLIELDVVESTANNDAYEWEVINGSPTTVKLWYRSNSATAPNPFTVRITEGLSFVEYFQVSKAGTASAVNTYTTTVSSILNFADGKTNHRVLAGGGRIGVPKSAGLFFNDGLWNMKMTAATTFQWKCYPATTSATVYDFVSWRY